MITSRFFLLKTKDANLLKILEEDYLCPICLDLYEDPVFEPVNLHIFCKKCMEGVKYCPLCRERVYVLFPQTNVKNQLSTLKIRCSSICDWEGDYRNLKDHQNSCCVIRKTIWNELKGILDWIKYQLNNRIQEHFSFAHPQQLPLLLSVQIELEQEENSLLHRLLPREQNCKICKVLYHFYLKQMEMYEERRQILVKLLRNQ